LCDATRIERMTTRNRLLIVLGLLFFCIALDQFTKSIAKHELASRDGHSYLADTIRLQYAENSGAFLSLGDSLPGPWRTAVFTYGVAIFLLGLTVYLLIRPAPAANVLVAWALVCAGGLSNLVDRVLYDGRVVDFLNLGVGRLRTGIFNVADVALTTGIVMLLLYELRQGSRRNK
jgi:signal peptidase II